MASKRKLKARSRARRLRALAAFFRNIARRADTLATALDGGTE